MKKVTGVELVDTSKEILQKHLPLNTFVKNQKLDFYQYGIIAETESDKQCLIELLKEYDVYEEAYNLYFLGKALQKNTFTDFGFTSSNNNDYLYSDIVIPFRFSGNNKKDIEAASVQVEEHLIAVIAENNETIYFVERHHQGLVEGIAQAYKIVVTFYS